MIPTSEPTPASEASPASAPTTDAPDVLSVAPALAAEVNGGVIARAELNAVLAAGIGRFLQRVHAEPEVIKGRFAGWRIVSLFAADKAVHVAVLQPGDTVKRANGQSIERPEQFQVVWDSLSAASELVLDIERAGHASKLRYTIAN